LTKSSLRFGHGEILLAALKSNASSNQLAVAARELSARVERLKFTTPVTNIYNPLEYAWPAHELYLKKYGGDKKRVIFLGMNPGPFGMTQTGVPFGEVAAVRDWLKISAPVSRPRNEHPKRPVQGFDCPRSEVSGRRLWGLFAEKFGVAENFFVEHFVVNYCPLVFCEAGGKNFTPDKLPMLEREKLFAACDAHLQSVLKILEPEWVVGVGAFARERADAAAEKSGARTGQILHPSPASPAANRGWAAAAEKQLVELGVWRG
jgi:single-strand selective monofunctional uracil DNA glycosylase